MNASYEAVLAHYGLEATRTNPRSSHENGVVEQRHRRLKNAMDQALILRGSRDFESEDEYRTFVRRIVDRRNRLVSSKLKTERRHLRPLPGAPIPEYVNYRVRVRKWSTIRVANRTYSVPSRLIGMAVDVRLYADHVKVYYKGHLVESMERVHGTGEARIDYRHMIGSLVRKPGAFARYRFREQMFPTHTFRLAYDALWLSIARNIRPVIAIASDSFSPFCLIHSPNILLELVPVQSSEHPVKGRYARRLISTESQRPRHRRAVVASPLADRVQTSRSAHHRADCQCQNGSHGMPPSVPSTRVRNSV